MLFIRAAAINTGSPHLSLFCALGGAARRSIAGRTVEEKLAYQVLQYDRRLCAGDIITGDEILLIAALGQWMNAAGERRRRRHEAQAREAAL